MDRFWNRWSHRQGKIFEKKLAYEESLTIELVDRSFYFNRSKKMFKLVFDVNFGEFDRTNRMMGKIKATGNIKIHKKLLNWAITRQLHPSLIERNDKEYLQKVLEKNIENDVEKIQKQLLLPVKPQELSKVIAKEIFKQLNLYSGPLWPEKEKGTTFIPVEIRYAPYALRYLHYRYRLRKN